MREAASSRNNGDLMNSSILTWSEVEAKLYVRARSGGLCVVDGFVDPRIN